jgi:TolB-like protein/Flp pilus assembly protein TadD
VKRIPLDPAALWQELQRRRVVRFSLWYVAIAWVAIQAADVLLDAFERGELMPWVVGAVAAGFPLAIVLSWFFDLTPRGVELTQPLPEPLPVAADWSPPPGSLAVLPFANLGGEVDNEYLSDGLAEEIRNELSRVPGLRVAARTSSFVFRNRPEDVRSIARRLDVAAVLEGGVRRQADAVRIYVQLVGARDGYQLWSANYERRLEDIFALQSEIAAAVAREVAPRSAAPAMLPATARFEAYNLYLRGRHHFHKRTEAALLRAVECFEQALALDPDYALAWSGLADATVLLSARFYGNLGLEAVVERAGPAVDRALALAPSLAEAHASAGLLHGHRGEVDAAIAALQRARALDPGYTMALVWLGLALVRRGDFREAGRVDHEAFRLDPLSPIVNANLGFDQLRYGDRSGARERFEAAIEIDPAFPVPHYGLSLVHVLEGDAERALAMIDAAIERAPRRAYYRARKGVMLLGMGRVDEAQQVIGQACGISPENAFDADLKLALAILRRDTGQLDDIATGACGCAYRAAQRAQAALALGDPSRALQLYAEEPPELGREIYDLVTDDWVWRLPHLVSHAHLRLDAGDAAAARLALRELLSALDRLLGDGVENPQIHYWIACGHAVLGELEPARAALRRARSLGWQHLWWQRLDWNLAALGEAAHD